MSYYQHIDFKVFIMGIYDDFSNSTLKTLSK